MTELRKSFFTGHASPAQYRDDVADAYRHNAFIEALPPIYSLHEIASRIRRKPAFKDSDRLLSPERRIHLVQTLDSFIEPMTIHLDVAEKFSEVIRQGYMARNPISAEWERQMRSAFPDLSWGSEGEDYKPIIRNNTNGFSIIGTSGVGKSTAIEGVLSLYPQVIIHTEYNGHPFDQKQLVWLKLECPFDGSIKQLCLNFFQGIDTVLGTNWYRNLGKSRHNATSEFLPDMAMLSAELGLGVLVIDEIQRLSSQKSGGANKMLNFFVELANTIGVPVVLVGTFKAIPFLTGETAQVRRVEGIGDVVWSNLSNDDQVWDDFVEQLWGYQWTNIETKLTDSLNQALYEESQGITDFAVKIYKLAQWTVIGEEDERIKPGLIRRVARENLRFAYPILEALRTGDVDKLEEIPDLPTNTSLNEFFKNAIRRVTIDGKLRTVRNQHLSEKEATVEDGEESQLLQVAQWLVQAGVTPKLARESALKAIERSGSASSLAPVLQDAYAITMAAQGKAESAQAKKERKSKAKKPRDIPYSQKDLRGLWEKSQEMKTSPYEMFVHAGVMRPDTEFLGAV